MDVGTVEAILRLRDQMRSPTVIGDLRDPDVDRDLVARQLLKAGVARARASIVAELRWLEEHAPATLEGRGARFIRRFLHRGARRRQGGTS